MAEDIQDKIKEFKEKEEKTQKKKRRRKGFLIFILIIIIIVGLYEATVIVKRININKLGSEYCEYNGEHPIQTGMKGETHSVCKGCSKLMKFEYRVTDELCETCAQEFHRCRRCGLLLKD